MLRALTGSGQIRVNSKHHQAVDKPGRDVVVCARCPDDGIAEAIYVRNHPFAVAVQWHPEWLVWLYPEHLAIFKALVRAAKGEFTIAEAFS